MAEVCRTYDMLHMWRVFLFIFCGKPDKEYKSKNRIDMTTKRKNFYLTLLVGYFAILILVVLIFWLFYRAGILKPATSLSLLYWTIRYSLYGIDYTSRTSRRRSITRTSTVCGFLLSSSSEGNSREKTKNSLSFIRQRFLSNWIKRQKRIRTPFSNNIANHSLILLLTS